MERAVIYARVSVASEDIDNQVETIRNWAGSNGYEVAGVFKDEAMSGASSPLEREAFRSMLKFCEDNGVRTILMLDLSRLGRSLPEAASAIKELYDKGYRIVFTKYDLQADPNTIAGKAVIYALLMAAEFERDFMLMRLEAARARGKRIGRPRKQVNMRKVKYYLRKGLSIRAVAKIMGVSPQTIIRRLREVGE